MHTLFSPERDEWFTFAEGGTDPRAEDFDGPVMLIERSIPLSARPTWSKLMLIEEARLLYASLRRQGWQKNW